MSISFDFLKLKKVTQDNLYESISNNLNIKDSQSYLPFLISILNFIINIQKKCLVLKVIILYLK